MEVATTKLSSRGQIVIPSEMREGFKEGDKFIIIRKGDDLVLRKEKKVASILSEIDFDWSDFSYFADDKTLGKIWLSKEEDEAWKDL